MTQERSPVHLYARAKFGAAGAVTSFKGYGIQSIEKGSVDGQISIFTSEKFQRLLHVNVTLIAPFAGTPVFKTIVQGDDYDDVANTYDAQQRIVVLFLDNTNTAVAIPSGREILIEMVFSNSTVDLGKGI